MRIRVTVFGLFLAALLFADGGAVEFRKQAGSLLITVFGAPVPLRAGVADLSVLVQNVRDTSAVLDAEVDLTLSRAGEMEISLPATRAQATNKLLYAAYPVLPSAGEWRLNVQVKSLGRLVAVDGAIVVTPRQTSVIAYWPYIAFVPIAIVLFLVNQYLKSRSRQLRQLTKYGQEDPLHDPVLK
jgi:hypothetical protein